MGYEMEILEGNAARKVSLFGVILVRIFPHSDWIRRAVQMPENMHQNNPEYGYFLRSEMG